MKIYISGRITGNPDAPEQFAAAEEELLQIVGIEPVNPLKNGVFPAGKWTAHMKRDITMLVECDAIYLLNNGHNDSPGSNLERTIAQAVGLIIMHEPVPHE